MYRGAKRAMDIAGALFGLLVLSPLYGAVALLVWMRMGRPVVFCQKRAGLNGHPFTCLKFRSMLVDDGAGRPDDVRLTSFGKTLRRWSLDELPQLLNVLCGNMSLVGPRPLYTDYVPLYSRHQSRRLGVKPGMTGWAQVCGRNGADWVTKFDLDVWYVDNRSLLLDARILFLTVPRVLSGRGVTARGTATVDAFRGRRGPRCE